MASILLVIAIVVLFAIAFSLPPRDHDRYRLH